ncbi:hypothetical protein DRN72_03430 [Methanosarcinales archaeon]|nr:MAG: hypothetical protein DRN72_03430 [Methanosarcinales archaeon]
MKRRRGVKMTIALLWDRPLLYERYLNEHARCVRVLPTALLAPNNFTLIIVPTGFAEPKYTSIGRYLNPLKQKFIEYAEKGVNILVFGPLRNGEIKFLPDPPTYTFDYGTRKLKKSDDPLCGIVEGDEAECDGYLEAGGEWEPVMWDEKDRVVMAKRKYKGVMVLTTTHELPTPEFIKMLNRNIS